MQRMLPEGAMNVRGNKTRPEMVAMKPAPDQA